MPRARTLSRRNVKGRGWHKRGYRENGELFIQLKRAYCTWPGPFSRTHSVNENATMEEFIHSMAREISMEDGHPLPEGLFLCFQAFRGKELEQSDELVKTKFDGAETVHAKVFDEEGTQYVLDFEGGRFVWSPK
ncbi:hypothetical protein EXIGLDRAFT_831709 [Exidia glandulosa HHB12029]|uniref:Uncharacterized protein n=1 Tax=Exidia glandulosa HHB12029 TaxID=1314781 RepID=A0A165MEF4_EXIGL|nr:hypothetical protein EXIGLDRAFT_831709 [Exidia glandulosa HHB12029]